MAGFQPMGHGSAASAAAVVNGGFSNWAGWPAVSGVDFGMRETAVDPTGAVVVGLRGTGALVGAPAG